MKMTEQRWRILRALSDGCPARRDDILTCMLADGFTDETLRKTAGFPFSWLLKGGHITRPQRGVYVITDEGRATLSTHPNVGAGPDGGSH